MGLFDTLYRYGQPMAALGSAAIAEPIAGLGGLLTMNPSNVEKIRGALTYQPSRPQGQEGLAALAKALMQAKTTMVDNNPPVRGALDAYNRATDYVGDRSALAGALMRTAPTAAMMFAGPGGTATRSAFANVAGDTGRGIGALAQLGYDNAGAAPAIRGPLAAQQGAITYHGSPHKFDAFDSSKIGSGEGNQAYGHGVYVAEDPSVAKSYQEKLSDPAISRLEADEYNIAGDRNFILRGYDADGGRVMKTNYLLEGDLPKYIGDDAAAMVIKNGDGVYENQNIGGGNYYKIDLPDEHIAKMLDWDKPLSEQPHILSAIQNAGYSPSPSMNAGDFIQMKSGEGFGPYLSEDLRKAGIPGIRYLDGGSRGVGEGTSNFVVFPGNEGLLNILERNGRPISGK